MKLLIITQKVDANDDLLGFFIGWLKEIATRTDQVNVITLFAGEYDLPPNVKVYSLGKEKGRVRLLRYFKFFSLIFKLLPKTDKVLAHMCPEYVNALWLINLFLRKDIYLWYTHRQVSRNLRLASKSVKKIFTASPESCQLESKKVKVLGHGIDLENYQIPKKDNQTSDNKLNIIYVGRISRIKNQQLLIKAAEVLVKEKNFTDFHVKLVGAPIMTADKVYASELEELISKNNLTEFFQFVGKVPNNQIIKYYQSADLSINLSPTGGLDKTVLESMACGVPVIVVNKSFRETLGQNANWLTVPEDEHKLAEKIIKIKNQRNSELANYLRNQVTKHHNLKDLINRLISEMSKT